MSGTSHHVYRVSGEEIIVGFVTVNISAEEATVKEIMENVLLRNDDISFIAAFKPDGKCDYEIHLTRFVSVCNFYTWL